MTVAEQLVETQFVLKAGSLDPHNPYFYRPRTLGLYKDAVAAQKGFVDYVDKYVGSFKLCRVNGSTVVLGVHYENGKRQVSFSNNGRKVSTDLATYQEMLLRFRPKEEGEEDDDWYNL